MLLCFQVLGYCLLFLLLVKCAVRNDGLNCIYFYPQPYIDEAQKRGLTEKDAAMKKGKRFTLALCLFLLIVLILILSLWNRVKDFKTACLQSALFLMVANWFDGIVLDRLWVGHSKIWRIKGMEGVPYVKPWKTVLVKRSLVTVLYLIFSLAVAGIVVLIGKIG